MLKIGVVGCGRISHKHFQAIASLENARCVACCDIVSERAEKAAHDYRIPYWTCDYRELLKIQELDLIAVCTPSGLHAQHGVLAACCGKHVLTEKPMAVRMHQADALIKTCRQRRVRLHVVLQNRLNPAVQLVRRAWEDGRFGRLYLIMAKVLWNRSQDYYDQADWRGTWELDGGAFMNQASHYVDLMQWWGGPVRRVYAQTATLGRRMEAEDTGSAILLFADGTIGSLNVTMLTYPENLEGSITLVGEKGTVQIAGTALNRIETWQFDDQRSYDGLVDAASTCFSGVYGHGHQIYYEALAAFMDHERQTGESWSWDALADGQQGRKSVEIITRLYKSSDSRKPAGL